MKQRLLAMLLLTALALAGCGGLTASKGKEEAKGSRFTADNYPLGLPEDLTVVPAKYPISRIDSAGNMPREKPSLINPSTEEVAAPLEMYRVQIFTSRTHGPALREQSIATEIFDRKVTLDYEVPYYKVRLGDFSKRREAEDYLSIAKDAGYDSAWVVRVTLNVQNLDSGDKDMGTSERYRQRETPTVPGTEDDSTANPGY